MKIRQVPIILCLGLLALVSAGSYFGFLFLKSQVRAEIKAHINAGISESELTAMTFNDKATNEISWIGDDEFIFKSQTYDVVRTKRSGGTTTYFVVTDKKEKELYEGLTAMTSEDLATGKSKMKLLKLGKIFNLKFLPSGEVLPLCFCSSTEKSLTEFNCLLTDSSFSPLVPPPESICS
jgi:hypothetical protein